MGNVSIGGGILTAGDVNALTSRTEDSDYPDDNVLDLWHLGRHFRAEDTDLGWLLKFDFGAAQSLDAIFLNDINFNKVRIEGHTADTWDTPDFPGSLLTVSEDERVGRWKIYIPLTSFNYRWLRIKVETGATEQGSPTFGVWKVGTVCCIPSVTTLTVNMAYGYQRWSEKQYSDIVLPHGGFERASLSDHLRWSAQATFGPRDISTESELWTMNEIDICNPVVWYENNGDTSKAYLCLRDNAYQGTVIYDDLVRGNAIRFKELI